jgi:hypothetical protein
MTPADKFIESFAEAIKIDTGEIYDRAKRFIAGNLSPDEVFPVFKLLEWYSVRSKMMDQKHLELSVARELDPEDVFDFEDLKRWAEENGFERPSRACNCDDSTCTACLDMEENHEG